MGLTAFLKKIKLGIVVDFGQQLNRTVEYFDSLFRSFFMRTVVGRHSFWGL